jgi:hypothetical protein
MFQLHLQMQQELSAHVLEQQELSAQVLDQLNSLLVCWPL